MHNIHISQGLDVNAEIDGRLALHYAGDYGQLEVAKFLISKVCNMSLMSIVKTNQNHFQGAKIDATDKHGITPVLAAIWEGHTACVKYLLDNVRIVIVMSNASCVMLMSVFQGASKSGKAPDGSSYIEAAEKEEIKALLK